MNYKTRQYLILGTIAFLAGCVSPPIMLDRVVVRNATSREIRDVTVRHEPSKKVGSASTILPGRTYDLGFSSQPLQAERAIVSWKTGPSRAHMKKLLLPKKVQDNKQARRLVYTIHSNGDVAVTLER